MRASPPRGEATEHRDRPRGFVLFRVTREGEGGPSGPVTEHLLGVTRTTSYSFHAVSHLDT